MFLWFHHLRAATRQREASDGTGTHAVTSFGDVPHHSEARMSVGGKLCALRNGLMPSLGRGDNGWGVARNLSPPSLARVSSWHLAAAERVFSRACRMGAAGALPDAGHKLSRGAAAGIDHARCPIPGTDDPGQAARDPVGAVERPGRTLLNPPADVPLRSRCSIWPWPQAALGAFGVAIRPCRRVRPAALRRRGRRRHACWRRGRRYPFAA